MMLHVYTIKDTVADDCSTIFLARNSSEAVRMVKDTCCKPSMLSNHPEDFELFHIGCFHASIASLSVLEGMPVSLGTVAEILASNDSSVPVEEMIEETV